MSFTKLLKLGQVATANHQLAGNYRSALCYSAKHPRVKDPINPQGLHKIPADLKAYRSHEEDTLLTKVVIETKGHDPAVLESYNKFLYMAAHYLDMFEIKNGASPPKVIKRLSLLKSAFIYKKHWSQYESRTHYKTVELLNLTGTTASVFLEYIQRNLPEGVAMKVTTHERQPLPNNLVPPEGTNVNDLLTGKRLAQQMKMEPDTRNQDTNSERKSGDTAHT